MTTRVREVRPASDTARGTDPILRVEDLSVSYHTARGKPPVTAVENVSFSVSAGQTFGLVGESGCGKTTAALALLRLLSAESAKVTGSVQLGGSDVLRLGPKELREFRGSRASMIFQDPMTSLDPSFTVGYQVASPLRRHLGLTKAAARQRAEELLREVGIPDPARIARSYPHQLSGGMRQRVMIAQAISVSPDILIADEPTTALDVTVQAQILRLLQGIQSQRAMALVLITHDLSLVAHTCDQVAVMYGGRIVEAGPAISVLTNPFHPYTRGLIGSIPQVGRSVSRLAAIPGQVPDPSASASGCRFRDRCADVFELCTQEPSLTTSPGGRSSRCWLSPGEVNQRGN